MKKLILFFIVILFSINSFGQNKKKNQEVDIVSHQVQMGESVRMLSKKYLVDPSEIYKLNKEAVNGISEGMVLKIPVPRKEGAPIKEVQENVEEIVQVNSPKEAIKQETPQDVISESSKQEIIKDYIKKATKDEIVGETQNQTKKIEKSVVVIDRTSEVNHTVLPKETFYSLSKKYNISPDEIKLSNQNILKNGLQVGQVLKIPSTRVLSNNETSIASEVTPSNEVSSTSSQNNSGNIIINHKVEPKETLYSLSKKYNVTVDLIKEQNALILQNGLQIGQILVIKK